jgi:hypothetical protein
MWTKAPARGTRLLILSSVLLMQGVLIQGQALRDSASSQPAMEATHFLWYTGHWSKTNKNQFIIDKNKGVGTGVGGGGTITIGSDGSVQMSGGTVDAWNKRMNEAEQSADQYLQILDNAGDNLEPSTHKFYELLKPDAEEQKQQIAALKIDPKQDILTPGKPDKPASNFDAATAYCKSVKSDYEQVMAFYKDHVKDHDGDLNVPMPPGFEYECASCDSNIRKVYASTIDNYIRDFLHPEDSIIRKGYEILHLIALGQSYLQVSMSADEYSALFSPNKNDPSKSGPCSYIDMTALSNAVNETVRHLYLRARKLVMANKNNFRASEAVSRTFMIIARQRELTSGGNSGYEEVFPVIQEMVGKAIDFYVQKFKNNDWREIGNLTYILSLFRQQALLGGANDKETDEFFADLQRVINGFELSVEMEIKVGNGPSYEYAHVKGKCHIIPEFNRDTNQCYKWVVADDNGPTEALGFYKKKNLQSIDFDVIANERVSPPQIPKMTYTGTKYYTALLRNLSMDFCNPGHDTIMLSGFVPNPPSKGTWLIPNVGKQNMGLNNMEQFFESMEEKKKMEESGEAQKQSDEMQKQAEQLRAKMEALQKDAGLQKTGQGGNQPNYMEQIQELREQMEALSTNSALGIMLYVDFLLPVQNNDMTLVKHVYDAKEINPEEAPAIMIGNYSILIQNKQNGPTKKLQAPVHVDNTIPKK